MVERAVSVTVPAVVPPTSLMIGATYCSVYT
jgi:hypothetical protein